jgi:hypothetical protein
MNPTPNSSTAEHGSSVVEYVGLGALATMLVSGIAAALDGGVGDRIGAVVVRRLVEAIAGAG